MKYSIVLMENEGFFGLACNEGIKMPFTRESKFSLDLREWHSGNQASSVLVIFSFGEPFKFLTFLETVLLETITFLKALLAD